MEFFKGLLIGIPISGVLWYLIGKVIMWVVVG